MAEELWRQQGLRPLHSPGPGAGNDGVDIDAVADRLPDLDVVERWLLDIDADPLVVDAIDPDDGGIRILLDFGHHRRLDLGEGNLLGLESEQGGLPLRNRLEDDALVGRGRVAL